MVTSCNRQPSLLVGELLGPAQTIHQFHLRDRRTGDLEQLGIGEDHGEAASPADRDVQAIAAVEEFDVPGEILA